MHVPHGGSEDTWRRQSSIDDVYRRRLSTISQPHAGDRFWSKCAMVCCTGCMSCWAIVYLPAGIVLMCQTSVMDPKNDFAHFPLGCKITDEMHFDMDSGGQCIDRYTYSFVVKPPQSEQWDEVYSSQTLKYVRCDCSCDVGNSAKEWFKYDENQAVDCWVPAKRPISGLSLIHI